MKPFAIFENIVISSYNCGRLDRRMLRIIANSFLGHAMRPEDSYCLTSKDMKMAEQIVVEKMGGRIPDIEKHDLHEWNGIVREKFNTAMGRLGFPN